MPTTPNLRSPLPHLPHGPRPIRKPIGNVRSPQVTLRRLLAAAARVDDRAAAQLITDALETDGALTTWQRLCVPALAATGSTAGPATPVTAPARATPVTAAALALAAGIRAALDERLTRLALPGRRPTVMLATAPGDNGDLPLAALATVLLEHGIESWRFGADLPWPALSAAVERAAPRQLVVWSSTPGTPRAALDALETAHPTVPIVAAGRGWPEAVPLSTAASICLALAGPS